MRARTTSPRTFLSALPPDIRPLLDVFLDRALPTLLRRLSHWRGLGDNERSDVLDDLYQELCLDCLQNPKTIVALGSRERHARWFRLLEQCHYQMRLRGRRRQAGEAGLAGLTLVSSADSELEAREAQTYLQRRDRRLLLELLREGRYLKNGRLNTQGSARKLHMRSSELRQVWERLAEALGYGSEFLRFWRHRLVEALLGLAADLLRDEALVSLHDEEHRRPPDPKGRIRRIRMLRQQISRRPMPLDIKEVLGHYRSGRNIRAWLQPRLVLEDAQRLLPWHPAVHLWAFEAYLAEGDLPAAITAIRQARLYAAEPTPVLLARARFLEARGQLAKAERLLHIGLERLQGDIRLHNALRRLRAG